MKNNACDFCKSREKKKIGYASKLRARGWNPGLSHITAPFHITSNNNAYTYLTITISVQKGGSMQVLSSFLLSLACQINIDSWENTVWGYWNNIWVTNDNLRVYVYKRLFQRTELRMSMQHYRCSTNPEFTRFQEIIHNLILHRITKIFT